MRQAQFYTQCFTLILFFTGMFMLTDCTSPDRTPDRTPGRARYAATVTVTVADAVGRTITIPAPDELKRIYVSTPMGLIFLYTLAPETLVGTPINFSPAVKRFLLPEMADLPNLGGQQSGARLNPEAVISAGTQLFLSMTSSIPGKGDAADADALQAQINAPVYVMNGSIEMFAENYRVFGKILGRGERAEELANYCDNVLSDVTAKVSRVQADKRIRLYYAQGHDCLATEPEDSMHAEVFKYANAYNVADVGSTAIFGMTQVSMEQLLRWNPEIIAAQVVCYPKIMSDPDWSAISAVKNGRVYLIPDLPFSWVDRPPSVNRFLGIQWAANLLYPELYDIDIARTAQEFYRLFYHIDVGTDEIRKLGTVE